MLLAYGSNAEGIEPQAVKHGLFGTKTVSLFEIANVVTDSYLEFLYWKCSNRPLRLENG